MASYWNILITLILLNTYHGFVLVDFFPMLQNWGFNLVMYISQVVLILYLMRTHRILEAQLAEAHPLICAEIQFRWLSRIVVSQRGQRWGEISQGGSAALHSLLLWEHHPNLKLIDSKGLQPLIFLTKLSINSGPELQSFGEEGLQHLYLF